MPIAHQRYSRGSWVGHTWGDGLHALHHPPPSASQALSSIHLAAKPQHAPQFRAANVWSLPLDSEESAVLASAGLQITRL